MKIFAADTRVHNIQYNKCSLCVNDTHCQVLEFSKFKVSAFPSHNRWAQGFLCKNKTLQPHQQSLVFTPWRARLAAQTYMQTDTSFILWFLSCFWVFWWNAKTELKWKLSLGEISFNRRTLFTVLNLICCVPPSYISFKTFHPRGVCTSLTCIVWRDLFFNH